MIDSNLIRFYRERWRAVEEIERKEQRAASIEQRWQQLNAILSLAIGLGLPLDNLEDQQAIVRERWAKLRARL